MGSCVFRRLLWVLPTLVGCHAAPNYYEDVKPILDGRCVECHTTGEVAPFSFETYADAQENRDLIANAVSAKQMPPWYAVGDHQTYRNDPSLSDEDIETLVEWAAHDAPEGDPSHSSEPYPSLNQTLTSVDQTLTLPEAYEPVNAPDDYRCFVLDWDRPEVSFVTGFDAVPGNLSMVHHMAAYLFRPDTPYGEELFEILAQWDAGSPGPGYPCFGGPSGGDDVDVPIQQLAQWVPGMGATVFPEGSGIEVPIGSKVVLQIHYNTTQTESPTDQSAIQFSVQDSVAKQGAFAPWLDTAWPLGTMTIPAGNEHVMLGKQGSPFALFAFLAPTMDLSNGFDIHSGLVHMHQLGKSATVGIHHPDGSQKTLLELDDYSFDWQLVYHLNTPVSFEPDDELSVMCTWDNSAQNQPNGEAPQDVNWGEGSRDEMCVANLFITER